MSKKLKGQGWQIEETIKVVVLIIIFMGVVLLTISATGGLTGVIQLFCNANPTWCGEDEQCVCCENMINIKMGFPFDDIYSREYVWTNERECLELIKENDGAMWWKENDPNLAKCGTIPTPTLSSGIVIVDTCAIPARYVSDQLLPCICCKYEPLPGKPVGIWDMRWRCPERNEYEILNDTFCEPMYSMPKEERELTLKRIGKFFGIGGEYCAIPYPYNMTTPP